MLILFLSLFYYLSYSAIQYALASTKETKKSTINSVNNTIVMVVLAVAILILLYNKDIFNNDIFEKQNLKYFYIPFGNYRIVFIQDTKNKDIILTAFANIKEDKIKKILDVGYIKVFKSFLIQ